MEHSPVENADKCDEDKMDVDESYVMVIIFLIIRYDAHINLHITYRQFN